MDNEVMPEGSPFCTARSKRTGQRCRRRVPGGGVCNIHGGKAPQVRRQREARLALAQAQAMYADDYPTRDPGEALLAAVADGDAIVQKLKQQIQARETLVGTDLLMLGDWLDRTSRMAKSVLDLKLDERRVRIAEDTGRQVADVIRGILTQLGHDVNNPAVLRVVSTQLRALAGGETR